MGILLPPERWSDKRSTWTNRQCFINDCVSLLCFSGRAAVLYQQLSAWGRRSCHSLIWLGNHQHFIDGKHCSLTCAHISKQPVRETRLKHPRYRIFMAGCSYICCKLISEPWEVNKLGIVAFSKNTVFPRIHFMCLLVLKCNTMQPVFYAKRQK